jgi:type II secretory pathway component PulF
MPEFSYKARRRSGELVEGVLDVADRPAALAQIQRLGLFPVAVETAKAGAAASGRRGGKDVDLLAFLPPTLRAQLQQKRKPKLQELATFTQQLANLLNSGMPLTVALNSMTHLESKGIPAEVSRELKQEVSEGKGLSDAMKKQPRIFSDLYVNMVRAGEQSGSLVEVLRRMATHFQQFAEVQAKFTSALIYPALVICMGMFLIAFFMFVMMPQFTKIFNGFDIELPLPTRMLIGFSNFLLGYWWLLGLLVVVAVIFFFRFKASEAGGRKLDEWKMKAPAIGKVVKLNLFGQFARTLGTLLQNGVPVLTALKITEQVMPNRLVREAVSKTREAVTDGKTLAQPMEQSKIFPQLMIDLVRIGEETGDVPGALNNLADTYENELQIGLRLMTQLIEPVLIVHGRRRGIPAVEHFPATVPADLVNPLSHEIANCELRIANHPLQPVREKFGIRNSQFAIPPRLHAHRAHGRRGHHRPRPGDGRPFVADGPAQGRDAQRRQRCHGRLQRGAVARDFSGQDDRNHILSAGKPVGNRQRGFGCRPVVGG